MFPAESDSWNQLVWRVSDSELSVAAECEAVFGVALVRVRCTEAPSCRENDDENRLSLSATNTNAVHKHSSECCTRNFTFNPKCTEYTESVAEFPFLTDNTMLAPHRTFTVECLKFPFHIIKKSESPYFLINIPGQRNMEFFVEISSFRHKSQTSIDIN